MNRIAILCIILFGITISSSAQDLENLWKVAERSNPEILEAEHLWLASEKALFYKGFWPNPQLKASYLNLPTHDMRFGRTPMSGKQLMVMQKIPFWHAPIKGRIAKVDAALAKSNHDIIRLNIWEKLTRVYYSLWYDLEEKKVFEKNLALYQKMVTIAQTRYQSGKGLEQDALRAQIGAKMIENQLLKNKHKRVSDHSKLMTLLGGEETTFKYKDFILVFQVGHFNKNTIIKQALLNNPEIRRLRLVVKHHEEKRRLHSSNWIPDLEVSGYYTWRDDIKGDPVQGEDFIGASLGISIPLMFPVKDSPLAEESEQKVKGAQQKLENGELQLKTELKIAFSKLEQLIASERLYRNEIIPQSQAAVESVLTAYQTGKVDFLTVVNNEALLIKQELAYKKIILDGALIKTRIARLSGIKDVFKEEKR